MIINEENSHMPVNSENNTTGHFYYDKEERKKLKNYPKPKNRKKFRIIILIFDIALLFLVYKCVVVKKKQPTVSSKLKKTTVIWKSYRLVFKKELTKKYAELRLIISKKGNAEFSLDKTTSAEFYFKDSVGKTIKTYPAKVLFKENKTILHVFYRKFPVVTMKKQKNYGVKFFNKKDSIELVLEADSKN